VSAEVPFQETSIEIMDADGSGKRTLFYRQGFNAFSGVFSPVGDEIALSVGRYFRAPGMPPAQIGLIKPDGSSCRLLVDDEMNNGFPAGLPTECGSCSNARGNWSSCPWSIARLSR
jgi:hypothetical protein